MARIGWAVLGVVVGYLAGVAVGAGLVTLLSANTHDKSQEMAMTAAFVTGPMGAVAGLAVALLSSRRKPAAKG